MSYPEKLTSGVAKVAEHVARINAAQARESSGEPSEEIVSQIIEGLSPAFREMVDAELGAHKTIDQLAH